MSESGGRRGGGRRSAVATGRGDDGTTGLLFGGERISKDDPRTEAFGAIDEAIAALGLARAELAVKAEHGTLPRVIAGLPEVLLRVQRELFVAGAELATAPGAADRQRPGETRVTAQMVSGLDELLDETEAHVTLPREFVVPGETRLSAVARAGADDRAPGGAAGRRGPQGRAAPRRPARAVPEPPRGPALDPGPGRRTGRVGAPPRRRRRTRTADTPCRPGLPADHRESRRTVCSRGWPHSVRIEPARDRRGRELGQRATRLPALIEPQSEEIGVQRLLARAAGRSPGSSTRQQIPHRRVPVDVPRRAAERHDRLDRPEQPEPHPIGLRLAHSIADRPARPGPRHPVGHSPPQRRRGPRPSSSCMRP